MRKLFGCFAVLICSLWLPTGYLTVQAAALNVLVGQNKPPYIRLETVSGYELELLREIVRRMGHEAVFVFVPNSRIRGLLESGNGDIASLQPNDTADAELYFSQPYIRYQNVLVSLARDELTITHPADLSDKQVVAFQGASRVLGADYRDAVVHNTGYLETVDQKAQVDMLFSGRAQAIVLDRNIFMHHQQTSGSPAAVQIHELFNSSLYRAAFRDPQLQRSFDRALLSVLMDNWYQQLQQRYFMQLNQQLPNRFYCDD
ncbi:MAG: transporter substrate-binding domain-containing protein [Gammaproteobacteria bacterium]|nr:transporter substrate-binding domain-containing protein [Gammaproteobacteria bacterium]MBU1555332.1 transporter substrate-binding domain-containing protein [Gammaproteobacteria bacterium]MBU2071870.1 transporter substrate-binding domain-containing protein [Gammaproteobacteria bacterium]MBU2181731.1 transporter substrate-binding domain-containing protein [Gammaproteobacteria bacterium]MBU2206319.1 transporter substrate-binding domain-containing protein [Gammaproteobacteria bacterium]